MSKFSRRFIRRFCITVIVTITFTIYIQFFAELSKHETRLLTQTGSDFFESQINDFSDEGPFEYIGLNQEIWIGICSPNIDFLCNVPLFPKSPNRRIFINGTSFSWPGNERYAERIFGFLRPPKTASYKLAISSDHSSELWLSSDEKSENSVLIAKVGERKNQAWTFKYDYWKYSTQISNAIELQAGKKYFIDIIHVQYGNDDHLVVQWKESDSPGNFSDIPLDYLTPYYTGDLYPNLDIFHYDGLIPEAESCKSITPENPFLLERHLIYTEHDEFKQVLPVFILENKTYTAQSRNITTMYQGIYKYFQTTSVYPDENKIAKSGGAWNTAKMSQKEAMDIANNYIAKLDAQYKSKYTLKSLVNIEKTNFMNGSRYLLEIDLMKTTTNTTIRLSEYLYQDKSRPHQLYYVDQMQWKRNAKITFIITAKNQGTWVQIFFDDMAKLLRQTRDTNVDIIIFDYKSPDLDLEKAVSASGIAHRIKTASKPGRYSRRESINLAIDLVDDPHSIVFLVDLHLKFGEALLNDVRKHTIEGQLVYIPLIIRQWQCSTPNNKHDGYYGYYENQGFGLVAMYKSDWDRVGGFKMDDKNKYAWGGEDYELIDDIYGCGLDYARVKSPYVYHYKHSKENMWE